MDNPEDVFELLSSSSTGSAGSSSQLDQVVSDITNMRIKELSSRFFDAMTIFALIASILMLVLGCWFFVINPLRAMVSCCDGCLCQRLRNRHWYGSRRETVKGEIVDVPDAEGSAQTLLSLFVAFSLRSVIVIGLRAGTNGHCKETCTFGIEILFSIFVGLGVWAVFKVSKLVAGLFCLVVFVIFTAMAWNDPDPWVRWPAIALIAFIGLIGYAVRQNFYDWLMETLCVVISCLVIVYVSSFLSQTDTSQFDTFRNDVFGDESNATSRRRNVDMIVILILLCVNQLCWMIATFFSVFGNGGLCHPVTVAVVTAREEAVRLSTTHERLIDPNHPDAAAASGSDEDDGDSRDIEHGRRVARALKGSTTSLPPTIKMTRSEEA
jgi:hypothetical protein